MVRLDEAKCNWACYLLNCWTILSSSLCFPYLSENNSNTSAKSRHPPGTGDEGGSGEAAHQTALY